MSHGLNVSPILKRVNLIKLGVACFCSIFFCHPFRTEIHLVQHQFFAVPDPKKNISVTLSLIGS